VGVTINGRTLEHAIQKMLSNPLEEVRRTGEEIKKVALQNVPTLVKYAEAVPYLSSTQNGITNYLAETFQKETEPGRCRLVSFDDKGEERVLAAVLYRYGNMSFQSYLEKVRQMPVEEKQALASLFLANLSRHDYPIRELEHMSFTFDIVLDQGAYFELKRHRIMTQTSQILSTHLGYTIPNKIVQAGLLTQYEQAMEQVENIHGELNAFKPYLGAYIVPNAYNRRVLLTMNLRSAFHLINLRTASNAHFSIRRIAQQIFEQILQTTPLIGAYLKMETGENWQSFEKTHFHKP